jgi:DNA-binding PadR family transcriptional regulator
MKIGNRKGTLIMFKKIRLDSDGTVISVATALVLCAIGDLIENEGKSGAVYGYQIMNYLQKENNWNVKSGTVYPILKKLEEDGYIRMSPDTDDSKRPRFFYFLLDKGKILITKLREMKQEDLDLALKENSSQTTSTDQTHSIFRKSDFADSYLVPFLSELDKKINNLISSDVNIEELENTKKQLENSIRAIDGYKGLFVDHISRIEKIRKMKE